MSSEKKIIFSAGGTLKQDIDTIYSRISAGQKKSISDSKEETKELTQQIKLLEKKLSLENKGYGEVYKAASYLSSQAIDPKERSAHAAEASAAKASIDSNKSLVEEVKKMRDQLIKQTSIAEKVEKTTFKKLRSEEDQHEAKKSLWRQEVRESDKNALRKKIQVAEKNNFDGLDPEQAEKLMYQKSLLGEGGRKNTTGEVALGTFIGNILAKAIERLGQLANTQSGEQGLNQLISTIPGVGGGIAALLERSRNEQYQVQTKQMELRGLTGFNVSASAASNTKLGYSPEEGISLAGSLITAGGKATTGNQTLSAMELQKAFGLSTATITQIVKDTKTVGSSADMVKIVSDVFSANPDLRKDRTKLGEVLDQSSKLTNQLASQTENLDVTKNIGLVGALRSLGGSFSSNPELANQRMMSINSSLTNPGTDYQKARSFGVLSGLNPGASYFQLMEQQEQGIGSDGYLKGLLNQLKRESGGGEEFMRAIQSNLGLSFSSSRIVGDRFEKDPDFLKSFKGGSASDLDKFLSGGLKGEAERNVSEQDKSRARLSEAFTSGFVDGGKQVGTEIGAKVKEAIKAGFDSVFGDNHTQPRKAQSPLIHSH